MSLGPVWTTRCQVDTGGTHTPLRWARPVPTIGELGGGEEAGLSSYLNVNVSTLLSTSVDWSSRASGWRMDTRTLLTVACRILCRAHRTEMALAVTLVTSRPSTGRGPGRQRVAQLCQHLLTPGKAGAQNNRRGSRRC